MGKAAGDRVSVHSAGTNPGSQINALSAEVLTEVGADMSAETPRPIDPELLHTVDLVVTLGRDAVVEVPPGVELRNWDTDEPSERGIDGIERIRLIRDATSTPASRRCSPNSRRLPPAEQLTAAGQILEKDDPESVIVHGLIAPAVDHRLKNDRYADVDGSVIGGRAAGYAEADAVCGAPCGESSPERTNIRNGCRLREFGTRVGARDVAIPKYYSRGFALRDRDVA